MRERVERARKEAKVLSLPPYSRVLIPFFQFQVVVTLVSLPHHTQARQQPSRKNAIGAQGRKGGREFPPSSFFARLNSQQLPRNFHAG